jgi:hypothetical protein
VSQAETNARQQEKQRQNDPQAVVHRVGNELTGNYQLPV